MFDAQHRKAGDLARVLREPVVVAGIGLILAQLVFRTWAVSRSWFYTDDYLLLEEGLTSQLTLGYLMQPDNGHLMPATRAVYWVMAHGPGLDWGAAAALSLLLQLTASLSALVMLVVLFGLRWGILPPLVLYLTSAMTTQASLWWVSSINQTPVQTTFFLMVACWVAYLRSRRWLYLLGTVAALLFGLLFFQKALFVLPVLVLLSVAYFAEGGLLARVRHVVSRYWPAAVVIGGVSGVFVVYYLTQVPPAPRDASTPSWWELIDQMALRTFVTGVTGGPFTWESRPGGAAADPSTTTLAVAWLILLAVVLASILLRRRAGRAWLVLLLYYCMLVGVIGVSRAGVFGTEIGALYRLQTDGLCAAALALGLAWLPVLGSIESSEPRQTWLARGTRHPAVVVAALTVAVAVAGTISWVRYVADWERVNDSETYVTALVAEGQRLPGIDLADTEMPESVLSDLTRPSNRLSDLSPLLLPEAEFPEHSGRLATVADDGTFRQALIDRRAASRSGPVEGCGWSIAPPARERVPLALSGVFEPWWMRIGYVVSDPGEVTVSFGDQTVRSPVLTGPNSLYIRVTSDIDGVRFSDLTTRGALCVDVIEVGPPAPGPHL